MLIKNLTSEQQALEVRELVGERRDYTIYVAPKGTTNLERLMVINPERYTGIFDIEGVTQCNKVPTNPVTSTEEVKEDIKESKEEEVKEDIKESKEENKEEEVADSSATVGVAPDKHVCGICGAEFASARGLSTHMNKAHAE